MTTFTINLPEHLAEQATRQAEQQGTPVDTFLSDAIADFLEELEDIAEMTELSRQYDAGEIKAIPWEVARARLMAKEDMQDFLANEENEV